MAVLTFFLLPLALLLLLLPSLDHCKVAILVSTMLIPKQTFGKLFQDSFGPFVGNLLLKKESLGRLLFQPQGMM
jgi:hypothetical protein